MGVAHNMVRKVSWGQIVKELEFQTKVFEFIVETVITEDGSFLSEPLKLLSRGNDGLACRHCTHIPHFIKSNICTPVSLADVRKSFDISPG